MLYAVTIESIGQGFNHFKVTSLQYLRESAIIDMAFLFHVKHGSQVISTINFPFESDKQVRKCMDSE
jgi:hypothetical protein